MRVYTYCVHVYIYIYVYVLIEESKNFALSQVDRVVSYDKDCS